MKKIFAVLLLLAMTVTCAAESTIPVIYKPITPGRIFDEEEATAYARLVWTSDFFSQDSEQGGWGAFDDGEGNFHVYGRYSEGVLNEENGLFMIISRYTGLHVVWINACVQMGDWAKCVLGYILVRRGVWVHNIVEG